MKKSTLAVVALLAASLFSVAYAADTTTTKAKTCKAHACEKAHCKKNTCAHCSGKK